MLLIPRKNNDFLSLVIGDWFGPASTAHLLRQAVTDAMTAIDVDGGESLLDYMCVHVARDCTVYRQDVRDACREMAEARRRRRGQRRKASSTAGSMAASPTQLPSAADEDFSLLDASSEYLSEAAMRGVSGGNRLYAGLLDRAPHYDEDFTLLSDRRTERLALDHSLYVNGEYWVVEGEEAKERPSSRASSAEPAVSSPVQEIRSEVPVVEGDWTPVLLLIPLRLGRDRFNAAYTDGLRAVLAGADDTKGCVTVGVIGGRPRHSLYFVGVQDEALIHLDPHLVQDRVDMRPSDFPLSSYHCRQPRKLAMARMDPSCCLGVYCETRAAFETWCENILERCASERYPMFGIVEGRTADADAAADDAASAAAATSMTASSLSLGDEDQNGSGDISEDFVFL